MTILELIAGYEEIIKSVSDLTDHPIQAVRESAKTQISRCQKAIEELKADLIS